MSSWNPSNPVNRETPMSPICSCLGHGQQDQASYAAIAAKFKQHGTLDVGTLEDMWGENDFMIMGMLRGLDKKGVLKFTPRSYLAAISKITGISFEAKAHNVTGQGGDWNSACTKQRASADFNVAKYVPDGRIFNYLPRKGTVDYLDKAETVLATDLYLLDGIANPEPSVGEYWPLGMPKQLGRSWKIMLPLPEPYHLGKLGLEKPRRPADLITLRAQNARAASTAGKPYARCVLNKKYKQYFGPKVVNSFSFVDSDDDELIDNERDQAFGELVAVYRTGELPKLEVDLKAEEEKSRQVKDQPVKFQENQEPQQATSSQDVDMLVGDTVDSSDSSDGDDEPRLSAARKGHQQPLAAAGNLSKQAEQHAKRLQGLGGKGAGKELFKKRERDSSDDEHSEAADSSDEEEVLANRAARAKAAAAKKAKATAAKKGKATPPHLAHSPTPTPYPTTHLQHPPVAGKEDGGKEEEGPGRPRAFISIRGRTPQKHGAEPGEVEIH